MAAAAVGVGEHRQLWEGRAPRNPPPSSLLSSIIRPCPPRKSQSQSPALINHTPILPTDRQTEHGVGVRGAGAERRGRRRRRPARRDAQLRAAAGGDRRGRLGQRRGVRDPAARAAGTTAAAVHQQRPRLARRRRRLLLLRAGVHDRPRPGIRGPGPDPQPLRVPHPEPRPVGRLPRRLPDRPQCRDRGCVRTDPSPSVRTLPLNTHPYQTQPRPAWARPSSSSWPSCGSSRRRAGPARAASRGRSSTSPPPRSVSAPATPLSSAESGHL